MVLTWKPIRVSIPRVAAGPHRSAFSVFFVMSFTRQRPLQLSSCAQHQTRHPVPTSRAGKGQVPRPTQCAARAASAESPQQSQHASQIAGTEIAQAAVAHENSALQQQTVADQQGSPGGLLNTFSSSLNPLWELVAGWKLQNRAPDSASSGELLARTAARASQVGGTAEWPPCYITWASF